MRSVLWIFIIFAFALAACRPATPETTEAPPPMEIQSPSPAVGTPIPPAGVTEVYPPPEKTDPGAYPGPGQEGTSIPWEEAVALVLEGKVAQVMQTHSLAVNLVLKDGQAFTTVEPEIDEIFRIVEQCGDLCKDIVLATE